MDERQCLFLDVCSNWGCHEQVMSDWAEATTMSMLGPVTCSALTVTDPLVPPDELVCWLMITLIPPGREMERFGLETRIDWPATVNPTSCALRWCWPVHRYRWRWSSISQHWRQPSHSAGLHPAVSIATGCCCHSRTWNFSARQPRLYPRRSHSLPTCSGSRRLMAALRYPPVPAKPPRHLLSKPRLHR